MIDDETAIGHSGNSAAVMSQVLVRQRGDALIEGRVSAKVRIDRLNRGAAAISKYQDQFVDALNTDFGCRPEKMSMMTDIAGSLLPMKNAIKHVRQWMKPERRKSTFPLNFMGGRSRIEYQPLGVVGIISPWNFPVNLTFSPLADILAAGNRALIKPSEFTPSVSEVIADCVHEAFDEKEVAVFTGNTEVAMSFSSLPFDHLVFTGSTSVGRLVMAAAAKNLVPVTLELGGKSPVMISRSANIQDAVKRIMLGKTMNAGQICIAPDYLLVPEEKLDDIIVAIKAVVGKMFPCLVRNPEYTSLVNERHFQRLKDIVDDAKAKGAQVIEVNPAKEDFSNQGEILKLPPTLIKNPTEDMRAMQEEIFGPLLPIKTYKNFHEVVGYVNSNPRPLALYYFGNDREELREIIECTTSGSVCVNDVVAQVMQEDLPFGGVGPAGMGAYHGQDGFKAFSHAKSVYTQTKIDVAGLAGLIPPYGPRTERSIKIQTRL